MQHRSSYVAPYQIAAAYVGLGETDSALGWLELGYAERDPWLIFVNADPQFVPLHSDPRFQAILRRMNFPH